MCAHVCRRGSVRSRVCCHVVVAEVQRGAGVVEDREVSGVKPPPVVRGGGEAGRPAPFTVANTDVISPSLE